MFTIPLLLLLAVISFSSSLDAEYKMPKDHDVLVSQGKMQYEIMKIDSAMPRYGECWKSALSQLEGGCKHLNDDIQSRLSLAFTNCFLAKVGMRTYPCPAHTPISDCLRNVDNNAFTSYSNFFTHTQNMCYFLQSQVWHEETEATIQRLATSSAKVSQSIAESSKLQETIVENQQATLDYQRQLVENGTFLSQAIEVSKSNVRDMLDEFRSSTSEQRTLIFEVFDRVSKLQNLVVSEVSWLYTVVFYGTCLLVIYLLTSARRTADARLWLFVILSANFAVERLICRWSLPDSGSTLVGDVTELVYSRVWLARHFTLTFSAILLTVKAVKFKDYNLINNSLLQEIKRQNLELKRHMETFQLGNRTSYASYTGSDVTDSVSALYQAGHLNPDNEDTGFLGDEDEWSDDDSDSFNSTKTDRTFDPGQDLSDDELVTAATSRDNSGQSTPTNKAIDSALEALSSNLLTSGDVSLQPPDVRPPSSSPSLQSSDFRPPSTTTSLQPSDIRPPSATPSLHSPESFTLLTPSKRGPGRPRGSRQTPTPDKVYNLRSRSSAPSPTVNPVLENESSEKFAEEVRRQLGTSRKNYAKWKMAVKKEGQREKFFSDDDN